MTTRVLTASPNTEIRQIAQVLFDEHIGTMPIIDEREHLIGLITRSDILQALIKPAPLDLWV
jgi:CBS-domain-containing membrane protein